MTTGVWPFPTRAPPGQSEALDLARWCRDATQRGEAVVVTCMGGLGRSGTVVACCLVAAGVTPDAAIVAVRAARGPRALETAGQESFVAAFASVI